MVGFKNRYLVMEVYVDSKKEFSINEPIKIRREELEEAIEGSILVNFGQCGLFSSTNSFKVKYWNSTTKLCIIRTSRNDYQKIWAAITMIKSVGHCSVVFNLLDLSGSIKACKTAALKCTEMKFEQYKLSAGDRLPANAHQEMQNWLQNIKNLEH